MTIDLNLIIVGESKVQIKKTLDSVNNFILKKNPKLIIICPNNDISFDNQLYKKMVVLNDSGQGIYQAMNLALDYLKNSSSYNWFLNSGDFAETNYLNERLSFLDDSDIFKGDIVFFLSFKDKNIINFTYNILKKFQLNDYSIIKLLFIFLIFPSSHQNILIKNSIHRKFDIKYKYSSDFNLIARLLFLKKAKVSIKKGSIAINSKGGLTDKNRLHTINERYLCFNSILRKSSKKNIKNITKLSFIIRLIILFASNLIKILIR